jgi:Flp pilus assembly protein TadD
MATCREVGYRDGDAAIKNATKACELSRWENPNHLDTLAAACAEVGRFDRAQEYQQKALKLAREKDTAEFQKRLRLYQDGRPYRE